MPEADGIGNWAFAAAALLVACSFAVATPLGRFKPVAWALAIFAGYNIVPFVAIAAWPDFAELLLGASFAHYTTRSMDRVGTIVLGCVAAAVAAQVFVSFGRRRPTARGGRTATLPPAFSTLILLFFALLTAMAAGLVWSLRDVLFTGYRPEFGEDEGEVLIRGTLSSTFLLMFVSYLYLWIAPPKDASRRRRRTFIVTTLCLLGVGAALLSLGGRLYVVSAALTCIAIRATLPRPPTSRTRRLSAIAVLGIVVATLGGIGVWRIQGEFTALSLLANLLAEPVLVSISLASLVASNDLPALAFPSFLLADSVGLLPSAIYPDKIDRLFSIGQGYVVESPSGGLNGLASLLANVGWLGTVAVAGGLAALVTRLSYVVARTNAAGGLRLAFVIATTLPVFSLCRDPFVVSVYKNLVQNALVVPFCLALLCNWRLPVAAVERIALGVARR